MRDDRTGLDIARMAKAAKPDVRYAVHRDGESVAAWTDERGWTPVAGKLIAGGWASLPYEILANGERMHAQEDWEEVNALECPHEPCELGPGLVQRGKA